MVSTVSRVMSDDVAGAMLVVLMCSGTFFNRVAETWECVQPQC